MNTADDLNAPPIHVVPFSHLDLFWTGTREECLSRGNYIIAQALDILEEHEDFCFLIETMNFLAHYVDCYPQETERIRKLVATGRLELGPLWSGIYLNLPGGETLARNALFAKRYARQRFDADPQVAHFGDLPGYTPQYPQIAKLAGISCVLMSRGGPSSTPLFHWKGLNGDTVLSYFVPWGYALFAMHADWHKDFAAMTSGGLARLFETHMAHRSEPCLIHWGSDLYAPHENLVHNVRQWNDQLLPKLRFSTLSGFFEAVRDGENIPVLAGELPSFWPNIESTWPHIWPEDLPCEAALQMAEFLSTYCMLHGWDDYPQTVLDDSWKALLDGMDHNQNCQGGATADRDKLQLKLLSRYAAQRIADTMAWRLAAQVPVPKPDMFPVVVFNDMSWRRSQVVTGRAGVFGDVRSSDIHAFDEGLQLIDDAGKTVPYVQLERYEGLSTTLEIAFSVDQIPATGYRTFYLVPGRNPIDDRCTCRIALDEQADHDPQLTARYSSDRIVPLGPRRNQGSNRYENAFYRMDIDVVTGEVDLFDQSTGQKLLERMSIVGVEERRGNYISDMTATGRVFPSLISQIQTIDNNAVWCRVRIHGSVYGMAFTQTITLFHDFPDVAIENEIDWQESRWVRLQQLFPYTGVGSTVRYGVPYGLVTFPDMLSGAAQGQFDEISNDDYNRLRLCRHWVDIGDDSAGITIGCDHRMWEFEDKLLRAYMVRGAGYCGAIKRDPTGHMLSMSHPPAGRYRFRYLIRPRRVAFDRANSHRCGWELNHPHKTVAVCGTKNTGSLPPQAGLLDLTDTSLIVTAIKKAEDGSDIVVRAFESVGRETIYDVPVINGSTAVETNILEETRQPAGPCRAFEVKTFFMTRTPKR